MCPRMIVSFAAGCGSGSSSGDSQNKDGHQNHQSQVHCQENWQGVFTTRYNAIG